MDFRDLAIFLGIGFAFMVVVMAIIIVPVNIAASYSCARTAAVMGVESSYSIWTDCMVKTDGIWEPLAFQRATRLKG